MRTTDERIGGIGPTMKAAMKRIMLELRVALPGIIQSFDAQQQTATVSLAIMEKLAIRGVESEVEIPLLVDVPVVMPRAGGYVLAFTPRSGDECLVIFADRCIDSWWQSGGVQSQADCRRHDLSDGIAIVGLWSQPNKPSLPASGVALQSDDGAVGVFVDGETVSVKGGTFNVDAGSINLNGSLTINGESYMAHKHTGVLSGGANTGGVAK